MLEDTVANEWESQRKRIYDHFGIALREEPGRESQAAFGRSKRSKNQAGMSKAGRSSMMGKSMHRSIIGAPSQIGAHQPGFSDVERTPGEDSTRTVSDRFLRVRGGGFRVTLPPSRGYYRWLGVAPIAPDPFCHTYACLPLPRTRNGKNGSDLPPL